MHSKTSNVIRVRLKCRDLLVCVVVEDPQLEVVRAHHKPIFASNELDAAGWHFRHLKGLDECSSLVVVYIYGAIVKARQDPRLRWMEVDTLYSVRPREQFSLKPGL